MDMKNRMVFVMAAILSVGSCMVEPDNPDQMVFYADAAGTRTSLQSDGSVIWQPKDLISIYHNDYHGQFASTNTTPSASVEFKGTVPNFVRDENQYFYAFYPYSKELTTEGSVYGIPLPSEQTAVEGTFADDLFISAARTKDDRLHFHNVCGGVKFSVAEDGIKKVVFKANGGESIAGKLKIEFDSDGIPVLSSVDDGSSSVTLMAPDQGTFQKGEWYYLVLAPGTLGKGYTIEFYDQEMVGKVSSGDPVQVKRSVWGVLAGLEPDVTFNEGSIEASVGDLAFYSVENQQVSQSLQITNTGQSSVTIHSVSVDGPFTTDFDLGATVDSGKSHTLTVSFVPTGTPSGTGELTIVYGAYQSLKIPLSYRVLPFGAAYQSGDFNIKFHLYDDCTVSYDNGYLDASLDFGHISVGDKDYAYISIDNECDYDVRLMVLGNPEGFYVREDGRIIDRVIPAGREDGVSIYFAPKEKADYSGTFYIMVFDPRHPDTSYWCFPYHVKGLSRDVTSLWLNPQELSFSPALAGYESNSATVKVHNEGSYPVAVTVVCPEGFSVSESHFMLAPWGQAGSRKDDLVVTFNPTQAKTYSCKLVFEGENLYPGPFDVDMTGLGFALQKDFANFGTDVLWAGCNLGAASPTEYGNYYAWGETAPKESYSLDNYKYYDPSTGKITKYAKNNSVTLESIDDAATNANPQWRMPTLDDWSDLSSYTTCKQITVDGVKGLLIRGTRDPYKDQAIFMPMAGAYDGANLESPGAQGYYWSSASASASSAYCYSMMDGSDRFSRPDMARYLGFSVRPVFSGVPVSNIVFDPSEVELMTGSAIQLTPMLAPANVTDRSLVWSSSNESVATVSSSGHVRGISVGSAIITAVSASGQKGICSVKVTPFVSPEAVDLGLSVRWASMNIGAFSPEEYGDYYAGGETEPKENYAWATYQWCNGTSSTLTKYCRDSRYGNQGYSDLKAVLSLDDDAAHVRLGGSWRMPTKSEWDELRQNCKAVRSSENGVDGVRLTGPNGNSIFFPAAGGKNGQNLVSMGKEGYYWSSTLNTSYSYNAFILNLKSSGSVSSSSDGRCYGFSIRPVSD